jgi:hypothetical protein
MHRIDTEAGAALDDLDFIGGDNMHNGSWLMLRINDSARKVHIRHQRGTTEEIFLASPPVAPATGYLLKSSSTRMLFQKTTSQWLQLGPPLFAQGDDDFRDWLGLTGFATAEEASEADARAALGLDVVTARRLAHLVPFKSADLAFASGGSAVAAHGLGAVPRKIWAKLKCTTGQGSYDVGEELDAPPHLFQLWSSGSSVGCSIPSVALNVPPKGGGTPFTLLTARWKIVLYAQL